jgi:hypothetical protein
MVKEMDAKKPGLVKDYMEKQIFRPYVEALITGIKDRFGQRQQVAFHLQLLLPSRSNELSMEKIGSAIKQYQKFLPSFSDVESEILRWKMRWSGGQELPQDITETLSQRLTLISYPNLLSLLQVLASLPVSTSTPERSFSTLKRIFTDERSSMTAKRVSELAICASYKEELGKMEMTTAVDKFAQKHSRRLEFL